MTQGADIGRDTTTGRVVNGEEATVQGQAEILQILDNFVESMALKCVVELGVTDALNSHPHGHNSLMSLSQIAARIPFPNLDMDRLSRVMRFLSCRKVFNATVDKESGETMFGLTDTSKWLLTDNKSESLVPAVLLATHPCAMAAWNCLSTSVAEGGACGFSRAHGLSLYDFQSKNYEYKRVFGEAMACNSRVVMKAVLKYYKDGFNDVGTIVDVGGGSGAAVVEIVEAHPHIKGYNFDLPNVVAGAPKYPNVTHVGGDMFATVPINADAIFLKWILHNWSDEKCVQILENCRKALAEEKGKLIIVEAVVRPESETLFDLETQRYDLKMLVISPSGKERNEDEWKKLLKRGDHMSLAAAMFHIYLCLLWVYCSSSSLQFALTPSPIPNLCQGFQVVMEIQTCGKPIDSLLEKVLCMNILSSDYFKELYRLKTYHEVIDEIYNQVDHVEPWMTGNCRGPSTAFCLLYKFFTMKLTVKQMHGLLKHPDSPYIRAIGFLYLRYAADPKTLWTWFEPYIKDEEEFSPGSSGQMTTMGVYVRDLFLGQYYFDTLFPRIPVPLLRQVVSNLEKMKLPTKTSGSTGDNSRHGSDDTARRPPSVKAALSVSFGQRAPHRASTRDSSPVRRTLPPPPYDRSNGDGVRSPSHRHSQSRDREYSDKDRERERERGRDQDRGRDRDSHRQRDRSRDRDCDRDRNRERERERERRYDYDRRSRYLDKRDIDDSRRYRSRSRDIDERRHYRSRSRSPSMSGNRSRSQSEQGGNSHYDPPQKEGSKASSNLAKLKDLYGDTSDRKGDGSGYERAVNRDSSGEEVIRLGKKRTLVEHSVSGHCAIALARLRLDGWGCKSPLYEDWHIMYTNVSVIC
ncbi:hypothetical protein V6N11_001048 [Hibiscus sabdariffa]|uniref:Pre-mRNA-splicing factor 38 n=1 Tax=Hibiscus sabdariffa TaxID=183260 RepID=A0ABR2RYL1_9ROSI